MKKGTKILSLAAALTLGVSALAFAGCGEDASYYHGEETQADYDAAMVNGGEVSSNGGFVVEKGDFVYFINGVESTTAYNGYGAPVKGSLMRIKKSDLAAEKYDQAKIVVPSLFTAQDFTSGLYIYGDYVYYATPTTDKNVAGEVGNSYIDFKRAKLDGTEAPMAGYYFRLSASTVYRYVEVDGVVFCLYEDSGALKSYNTVTGENTTLVKGAADYIYDTKDLTNPNVYYTMSVTYDAEKDNPSTPGYNQIYCVNAAAQVKEVNADQASYTVADKNGNVVRTYDFDETAMNKNAADRGYNLADYTTYPYVNLGELVLDGVGSLSTKRTHYNEESAESIKASAAEVNGYTYTIKRYETSGDNVGLYFTRVPYSNVNNSAEKLYYVEESEALADGWNTVAKNNSLDVLGESANIPDTSLIEISAGTDGKREFIYMYTSVETAGSVSNRVIKRVTVNSNGSKQEEVRLTKNVLADKNEASTSTEVTLWQTRGEYLYYYKSGSQGRNLLRIKYTGEASNYHEFSLIEEYQPMNVPFVEYNINWYQPEFVKVDEDTEMLLYANVQNYGTTTTNYNYVYAAKMGDLGEMKQANEDLAAYQDYRAEYEDESDKTIVNLIDYLFGSELSVTDEAKTEYIKKFNESNNDADGKEGEEFYKEIVGKFRAEEDSEIVPEIKTATAYAKCISRMTDADEEKIAEAWDGLLLYPEEEETVVEEGMEPWAIWLIVIGSVLFVILIIGVPTARYRKKKKAAKREAEAIVNSYKRQRIDTTDDKTIDVYADEETPAEETTEEPAEETTETPVEDADSEEKTE